MKKIVQVILIFLVMGCQTKKEPVMESEASEMADLLAKYTSFQLTTDLSRFSDNQRQMIRHFIEAAQIMDDLFWMEAYGSKEQLLSTIDDPKTIEFVLINYGPWDRLNNNEPFIEGAGTKRAGANYYPSDMSKEEFEKNSLDDKNSQYTILRRDEQGNLITVPYREAFKEQVTRASELLTKASELADHEGFSQYLKLRAEALLTDDYQPSDMAWMDMKDNPIELVIGPIENYEDQLYNYKTAHEAYVLIKDMAWSDKLSKYAGFLPELQENLPVDEAYKKVMPGSNADLNAYDVIYYAGDCNAGSKTIAINLPNDEEVQLAKGTRRLQLKNAMRAKFDKILVPISEVLIAEDQRGYINFDAFFANTMFHEVAHGLGIKNTLDGQGTVRKALKEHASALEEGKADILGLYMITQLMDKGELDGDLMDYYTTFLAGIFRSVRFGASSAHGKANMIRFNYFQDYGAFTRDEETGTYRVSFDNMQKAMEALSREILTIQGDGDYDAAVRVIQEQAVIGRQLSDDLERLEEANIPVDIVFEQGLEVLGL